MPVYWLIQAQDALQNSLGAENLQPRSYEAKVQELSRLVGETFPQAEAVLVADCLRGYSSDPEKHVLRVEAVTGGVSLARIVKIAPPADLAKELDGWRDCSRPANQRGRVFMELAPGKRSASGNRYETLVYEDALQTFRAAELRTLEEAVGGCTRWGQPSAESLEGILDQVFAELADRLYVRSAPAPVNGELADRLHSTLGKGLPRWQRPGTLVEQCRRVSLALLPGDAVEFFDPVEYLPRLFASGKHLPEVLRGPAHGDLHGRNVLVGIVEGEARFPALFDYDKMARDSLPGWDFAKLETELKVRALGQAFAGDEAEFVRSVCRFEKRLAERTEENNNRTEWPRSPSPATAEERLACVLLALRRQAKRCLETLQGRSRSWLHEYYFLLAVYGVYAGKFENYRRRDAIAAFLCGGLAATRFAWAKSSAANEGQRALNEARRALADGDSQVRPAASAISHHAALVFARQWARSRRRPFVEAAVEILNGLRKEYPYMLEVGQELALALLELGNLTGARTFTDRAERLLCELDEQCPTVSMETLCRWGRLWKDRGDQLFGSEVEDEAEMSRKAYHTALAYYRRAYAEFDGNYYPGINAATLNVLAGRKAEADRLAQEIIHLLDEGRDYRGEELAWVWATLGEAHLILGGSLQAAEYYRRAIAHPACRPHHVDSMHAQVNRILRVRPSPEVDFDALFDQELKDDREQVRSQVREPYARMTSPPADGPDEETLIQEPPSVDVDSDQEPPGSEAGRDSGIGLAVAPVEESDVDEKSHTGDEPSPDTQRSELRASGIDEEDHAGDSGRFPKIPASAASERGAFGDQPDKVREPVDCTVFAPPEAGIGDAALVQVFAHTPPQAEQARAAAREFDSDAQRRGFTSLGTEIARGSKLTFELLIKGLPIDDPVQELIWKGRPESVQFEVRVPADTEPRTAIGKILISQDTVPIGTIRFKLKIVAEQFPEAAQELTGQAVRYRRAFVSYASQDRPEVLRRVQMLAAVGIEFFQDLLSLDPGARWAKELYRLIEESDVLFLFWSSAAKESEWVTREWQYALDRKGDDFIHPVMIEGPPPVPPPPGLAHIHFNDKLLYFLASV